MADDRSWIVTASGERPLGEVAEELRGRGFTVQQVLDEIGCVTGTASDDVAARLRTVTGVADVTRDAAVDIGPPDTLETW